MLRFITIIILLTVSVFIYRRMMSENRSVEKKGFFSQYEKIFQASLQPKNGMEGTGYLPMNPGDYNGICCGPNQDCFRAKLLEGIEFYRHQSPVMRIEELKKIADAKDHIIFEIVWRYTLPNPREDEKEIYFPVRYVVKNKHGKIHVSSAIHPTQKRILADNLLVP